MSGNKQKHDRLLLRQVSSIKVNTNHVEIFIFRSLTGALLISRVLSAATFG